jgi:hypothetical protein
MLRKGGIHLFNQEELKAVWPIVMKRMIAYAMSTKYTGFQLRNFLKREDYIPDSVPWTHVRFYWTQWCEEAEESWKQLWEQAWPFDLRCAHCGWTYFRHDDFSCTYCHDKRHNTYLPCNKCHCNGTPNLFGIIKCPEHAKLQIS